MVELNEIALENVVGGKVPQCAKNFGLGFAVPYVVACNCVHDAISSGENKTETAGFVVGIASMSALSIGAYEGVKYIRRKLKGRK